LDLHADPPIFETAVRALAEGNAIRATARIVQVDKDAVCAWLDRAAQHCRLVMLYLWRDLHVIECQLDELWSFVHTKQHHVPFARLYDETYGDAWVWIAFAPVWRLVVAFVIGKRTQQSADLLLERVLHVTDAIFRSSPAINDPSIGRLCGMHTACGINRHAKGIEAAIPHHCSCHYPGCSLPSTMEAEERRNIRGE
jgi:hypothetical protein